MTTIDRHSPAPPRMLEAGRTDRQRRLSPLQADRAGRRLGLHAHSVGHRADWALDFLVDSCSPAGILCNFRHGHGCGSQAIRLTARIELEPPPGGQGE